MYAMEFPDRFIILLNGYNFKFIIRKRKEKADK